MISRVSSASTHALTQTAIHSLHATGHGTACVYFFLLVSLLLMIPIHMYLSNRHLTIIDVYKKAKVF